jgi:perosamine synthetase
MTQEFINFVRKIYNNPKGLIPLYEPTFGGNEKKYLNECIDTSFVSSVGKFVNQFEEKIVDYTGSKHAIATVNGTAALHIALLLSGVKKDDEVITQPLTFVATANAIAYTGAKPVFLDVDKDTMGLSPVALRKWLRENIEVIENQSFNKTTNCRLAACIPMHTFGHPCKIDEIKAICDEYYITLIEDAAESLGSRFKEKHTGTYGLFGILSFNGNKTITTGGGGMLLTDDENLAKKAKHITTTAKKPHRWEYVHDMIGYNYRLTNLAAALGVAQMEQLPNFIKRKRELALAYAKFFKESSTIFVTEKDNTEANYWLNAIILKDRKKRDQFLERTNAAGIMTRPIWGLMNKLPMFEKCQKGNLNNAKWLAERVVNITSGVI